ncbi:TonB family protein [Oscillatoria acuminata]|uniref:TonB family protein n=1 Tax=Oscillatoria acuminata PCC 6304 TaxID=56110 RepID=K9TNR8_9CYAN|nr:TonB family protein [Oscillatoria acuminata]AFY84053.1 TonB family protein [Oscillatoria acuminata PCC 6304]
MTVSTVAAKGREQQEQQIARFIKLSVMGSAVVHLAALAFVMPLINLKSDGTEDPIEFIVLEESTATPEELMPESETIASPTPEPTPEIMPEPEAVQSPTPEPTPELMPEPEVIESPTPEPTPELMPEPESVASPTPEPTPELMPEPESVASPTPEPLQEPEPLDGWQETPSAEVPEAMETPRSDLRAEALPRQRPPEPVTEPAPMPPQEMSPFTNSSPLDPGHNSRIANSNNIQGSRLREPVNPGRLPEVPQVPIVDPIQGQPLPVEEESPFHPGAIANGESEDPFQSNLDRLSEPWEENAGGFPEVEADSTLGGTRNLENESGPEAIACRRCDPPPYPQIALDNAWEGTVILIADIAPDGTVISAEIQQSSDYSILDDAAREQVERWTFDPSEQGQQGLVIPVPFEL